MQYERQGVILGPDAGERLRVENLYRLIRPALLNRLAGDPPPAIESRASGLRASDCAFGDDRADAMDAELDELADHADPAAQTRLVRMHGRHGLCREHLHLQPRWQAAVRLVADYEESPPLSLDL